jgi:hypothetical protein
MFFSSDYPLKTEAHIRVGIFSFLNDCSFTAFLRLMERDSVTKRITEGNPLNC